MPVAIGFYRDVLGFEVVQASGKGDDVDWVLLKLNNIELMLNTAYESRTDLPNLMSNAQQPIRILLYILAIRILINYIAIYWAKVCTLKSPKLQATAGRLFICLILMVTCYVFTGP